MSIVLGEHVLDEFVSLNSGHALLFCGLRGLRFDLSQFSFVVGEGVSDSSAGFVYAWANAVGA